MIDNVYVNPLMFITTYRSVYMYTLGKLCNIECKLAPVLTDAVSGLMVLPLNLISFPDNLWLYMIWQKYVYTPSSSHGVSKKHEGLWISLWNVFFVRHKTKNVPHIIWGTFFVLCLTKNTFHNEIHKPVASRGCINFTREGKEGIQVMKFSGFD